MVIKANQIINNNKNKMKLIKKYNQIRRDCYADLECENCGHKETDKYAYDDDNFWENVIPNRKCSQCGKSTNDLGIEPEKVITRYPEGEQH
ncbi:MAG: hypothetical protein PHN89_00480 [Candidatus Pacebacteria bacterium]|nr:hypothetical protein [Candidatus Paceibacterota bacterium]